MPRTYLKFFCLRFQNSKLLKKEGALSQQRKKNTVGKAKQPATLGPGQKHVLCVPLSFITALLWPSTCLHVLDINELSSESPARRIVRANTADLRGPCYAPHQLPSSLLSHFFSSAAHMVTEHAQCSWSDSLTHPFLLPFISCLSSPPPLCLSDSSSLFLFLSLFKDLLYSFHSLSIALEANSQSQWVWVTRDKYNISDNACKLHTYGCMFTMHGNTHLNALRQLSIDSTCRYLWCFYFKNEIKKNPNPYTHEQARRPQLKWFWFQRLKQFDPNGLWVLRAK